MNKSEKIIVAILGLLLVAYMWRSSSLAKKEAEERAEFAQERARAATSEPVRAKTDNSVPAGQDAGRTAPVQVVAEKARADEQVVALTNNQVVFEFSTYGATLKSAELKEYFKDPDKKGEHDPRFRLDFSAAPALALSGVPGLEADADWAIQAHNEGSVTFAVTNAAGLVAQRKISLKGDYQLDVAETFTGVPEATPTHLSLGVMSRTELKKGGKDEERPALSGDISIDSFSAEKSNVIHWNDTDHQLKGDLTAASGGCSCSRRSAQGLGLASTNTVESASKWIAVKNDYFVAALVKSSEDPVGFSAVVTRQQGAEQYEPKSVSAAAAFSSLKAERSYTLYVGPKKQSVLWGLGLRDVMDFGMWRWLCYGMVWVLNLFYSLIPNYGVAIILLTILVRILFWPLTHKSTIGMRKMQEIQPLVKAIQAKYKGNPQRLQQETWQLYREHKVNPFASCLPMLVQIPVFFALFVVLRGAVELRYASFLWIRDLSQPEALGAGSWFPFFGGLNILPILMAATMALQSALSPSSGDQSQQRMMMWFMPIMMLVMFYNFASALSLYWTLSQVISIAQTWWIRKKYGTPAKSADGVLVPDAVEMPQTRQMRRHP